MARKKKITFMVKGSVFDLTYQEIYILINMINQCLKEDGDVVEFCTDYTKYRVGWQYAPISLN